jgi:glutamate-5-semialdehyde dehydrogenase
MSIATKFDLDTVLSRAQVGSRTLSEVDRDEALLAIADELVARQGTILKANSQDVIAERGRGTSEALVDRLELSPSRIESMAQGVVELSGLPDPLHRVIDGWRSDNGLAIRKVTVPFGVIAMIYESRPNVTVDAAGLALKAGSSAVLRGSSNTLGSNRALVNIIRESLERCKIPVDAVQLVDSPDRAMVTALLNSRGKVDLVIPRGGGSLIDHVVANAKVPVIETGVGNCHIFVDAKADLEMVSPIVLNAKVQRPGVCNSVETLLVHKDVAHCILPEVLSKLNEAKVKIVGCHQTREVFPEAGTATEEDWFEEYLDLKISVRVVDSVEQAIEHINTYGTKHSDAIITADKTATEMFMEQVDSAAVFVNASTRFTDGHVFGFGAELGISTQKLHARGPLGLNEIVTYKFLITGDGQVRE